jgi:hypothetical protein
VERGREEMMKGMWSLVSQVVIRVVSEEEPPLVEHSRQRPNA